MKPKEFDVLVKQKFEENDFEYSPANWQRLEEELDGRGKKRHMFVGWLIPLMGVAASMALAFGVSMVWKGGNNSQSYSQHLSMKVPAKSTSSNPVVSPEHIAVQQNPVANNNTTTVAAHSTYARKAPKNNAAEVLENTAAVLKEPTTALASTQTLNSNTPNPVFTFNVADSLFNKKKKKPNTGIAINTFRNDIKLPPKLDNGTTSSSYARSSVNGSGFAAKNTLTSKNSSAGDPSTDVLPGGSTGVIKVANRQYNLYYAQVTPSIGYKIIKRMSIGIGPDFQKMLVDGRPQASTIDRGNIKEAPMFDVGLMGKTEFAFTKNIKAAVYYREGINDIVTPTNKYIDRSYLQLQLKCTILNK